MRRRGAMCAALAATLAAGCGAAGQADRVAAQASGAATGSPSTTASPPATASPSAPPAPAAMESSTATAAGRPSATPSETADAIPAAQGPCGSGDSVRPAGLMAFDGSGRVVWQVSTPARGSWDSQADPVVDGTSVFGTEGGAVVAVDAATGGVRWRSPLPGNVFGAWASGSVLVVDVDQVGDHARMVGLDEATGALRWTRRFGAHGLFASPVLLPGGGLLVQGSEGSSVTVLDTHTGADRWSHPTAGSSRVTTDDGVVVVASARRLTGYAVDDGRQEWSRSTVFDEPAVTAAGDTTLVWAGVVGPSVPTQVLAVRTSDGSTRFGFDDGTPYDVVAVGPAGVLLRNEPGAGAQQVLFLSPDGTPRWRHAHWIDRPAYVTTDTVVYARVETHPATDRPQPVVSGPVTVLAVDAVTGATRWSVALQVAGITSSRVTDSRAEALLDVYRQDASGSAAVASVDLLRHRLRFTASLPRQLTANAPPSPLPDAGAVVAVFQPHCAATAGTAGQTRS